MTLLRIKMRAHTYFRAAFLQQKTLSLISLLVCARACWAKANYVFNAVRRKTFLR
jgi:hypothetical protein